MITIIIIIIIIIIDQQESRYNSKTASKAPEGEISSRHN